MERLAGRVVVVTGGARGIGEAIASLALKEGAKVASCDVAFEGEKDGAGRKEGLRCYGLDVTKEEDIKKKFKAVSDELGPIYGLVNNAGISGAIKPVHQLEEEDWTGVMDVNAKGVFLCTKHAVPYMMKNGGGSIVNISSTYGIVGTRFSPPYSASKGAVRVMTKVDALSYAEDHIRVNSVHPGPILTPRLQANAKLSGLNDAYYERLIQKVPMGRLGRPEEIANAVVFLLSDDSSYMTGSELVVDGGYTCQ